MKLPGVFNNFFHRKEPHEVFLSLLLAKDGVAAAAWYVDTVGSPHLLASAHGKAASDSWESRTECADRTIAAIEDKISSTAQIRKTVLGLPCEYLTQEGNIHPDIRKEIKHLTTALDLTPIGFVPIHQALVYKLKKDEGMPPSIIILEFTDHHVTVNVYKVGNLIGQKTLDQGENLVEGLEEVLKSFTELEVLPSRILLYGMEPSILSEGKAQLLRHPWTTKANFLHFPKFDEVPITDLVTAVSLAGASELATTMTAEPKEEISPSLGDAQTAVAQPTVSETSAEKETPDEVPEEREEPEEIPAETPPPPQVVAAEAMGFRKADILEEQEPEEEKESREEEEQLPKKAFSLPKLPILPKISLPPVRLPRLQLKKKGIAIAVGGAVIIFVFAAFWALPKATVTVLASPQTIQKTVTVTVDPTATVADSKTSIIPGRKQEKSLSGNKTIPVTGTKQVGDPAKGSVTIYNKSSSPLTFSKGTALSASGVEFTLDSDATVASASENLVSGTVTFGKTTGSVTASNIGANGNLPAGTEFTFKNVGSDTAVARNENAFGGGTSRTVTVVSRSDQDALVQGLTSDLLTKAKSDLSSSVSGGEKLLDQTITTNVKSKTFSQELGQESQMLTGGVTVDVSGTSYNNSDLTTIFRDMTAGSLQPGYNLATERTEVTLQNVQIKKDGTIVLTASLKGIALPSIDLSSLRTGLAGKSVRGAQDYLKKVPGVGGAEFRFRWNVLPNRLPWNSNNISISVAAE